jgi:outer membrane receptor protein involved in Fe transport
VIAGVTVTVTSTQTGLRRSTTSGAAGSFTVTLLEPGEYRLSVVAPGFRELVREPVRVGVTRTASVDLVLQVGSPADQAVVVRADASALATAVPALGNVFTARQVTELPLVTRNFTQLLSLEAGVLADLPNAAAFGHGSQGLSVNGSRLYDNSVQIDGVPAGGSVTNGYTGIGPGPLGGIAVPAPDAVEEFIVQKNVYSAEFGRAGGATVNLVTRSGTNEFHGAAYEFFRNEALNANEFFYKRSQIANGQPNRRPILRENRFGGTLGGPLRRDRTFFFGAYQGTRQLNGAAPGLIANLNRYPLLPTERDNEASLRRQLGAIWGGRRGFPFGLTLPDGTLVNTIAADGSNISPVAIRMLMAKLPNGVYLFPSFPASGFNDAAGGRNGGEVFADAGFSFPSQFDEDQLNANLDHLISARQTLSARVFSAWQSRFLPAGNLPGFTQESRPQNRNAAVTHTLTLGPTAVNEARAGFVRITNPNVTSAPLLAEDVGMRPAGGSPGLPQIAIAGSGLTINSAQSASRDVENMYSVSDALSVVRGGHSLRLGGSLIHHQLSTDSDLLKAGQIIIIGFEDFLLGANGTGNATSLIVPNGGISNLLATAAQTGSFAKAYRFNDASLFLQDDWRIRRNLTVNLGLRYDYFGWPVDMYGRIGNFDASLIEEGPYGIPPAGGSTSGYVIAGNFRENNPGVNVPPGIAVRSDSTLRNDLNNFGPRIGFAWQPAPNWSVRGGYGIFYPRVNAEIAIAMAFGFPFNSLIQTSFTPSGSLADPFSHLNLPPDSAFPLWAPRLYDPAAVAAPLLAPVDEGLRNPYVQQWNFSVQRELWPDLVVEGAYVGSHGLRLINTRAGNTPALASPENPIRGITNNTSAPANIQARAPVAGILADRGLALTTSDAESKYHAALATVTKRFSRGLQFLSAFTFGKSIDNNSLTATGSVSNAQTPGDNRHLQHYGLSSFDRKYRWATSFVYELPFRARSDSPWRWLVNGWQTSGIMILQSGQPLTFLAQTTGSFVKLQGFLTPDLEPGATLADIRGSGPVKERLDHYFSSPRLGQPGTVFVAPAPTSFGALGRGLDVRTPGQKSLDLAIAKQVRLSEQAAIQLRFEAYNAMNGVNFGAPATNVSNSAFGTITSTTTAPRVLQLALKIRF